MTRHIVRRASFLGDFINALFLKDPYLEPKTVKQEERPPAKAGTQDGASSSKSANTPEHSRAIPTLRDESRELNDMAAEAATTFGADHIGKAPLHTQQEEGPVQPLTDEQLWAATLLSQHLETLRTGLKRDLSRHLYDAFDFAAIRAAAEARSLHAAKGLEETATVLESQGKADDARSFRTGAATIRKQFESNLSNIASEVQYEASPEAQGTPAGTHPTKPDAALRGDVLRHLTDNLPDFSAELPEGLDDPNALAARNTSEGTIGGQAVGNAMPVGSGEARSTSASALFLSSLPSSTNPPDDFPEELRKIGLRTTMQMPREVLVPQVDMYNPEILRDHMFMESDIEVLNAFVTGWLDAPQIASQLNRSEEQVQKVIDKTYRYLAVNSRDGIASAVRWLSAIELEATARKKRVTLEREIADLRQADRGHHPKHATTGQPNRLDPRNTAD